MQPKRFERGRYVAYGGIVQQLRCVMDDVGSDLQPNYKLGGFILDLCVTKAKAVKDEKPTSSLERSKGMNISTLLCGFVRDFSHGAIAEEGIPCRFLKAKSNQ